jgi:hypothetical protein
MNKAIFTVAKQRAVDKPWRSLTRIARWRKSVFGSGPSPKLVRGGVSGWALVLDSSLETFFALNSLE